MMTAFLYTGTADDFTVWLYPTTRTINRQYKSGKRAPFTSDLFYIQYQAGSVMKRVGRPRNSDYIKGFLHELGFPVTTLRWHAAIAEPYQKAPWRVTQGSRGIYFISAEGANLVKIGYAKDVATRMEMIRAGCPYPMKLLFVLPGPIQDEHKLHIRFKAQHFYGEWFILEGELRDFVDGLLSHP
jgi:hypothetical protein